MNQVQLLTDIATYGFQAGFWAAFLFPFITGLYWPWWRSTWGWNIITLEFAIAVSLVGFVLQEEFGLQMGHTPGHLLSWTIAIASIMVPAVIIWRAILIWLVQRRTSPRTVQEPQAVPEPDFEMMQAILEGAGYTVTAPSGTPPRGMEVASD